MTISYPLSFLRERRLEDVAHHERVHVFVDLAVHDHDRTVRAVAGTQARAEIHVDLVLESALRHKALARLDGLLVPARETGTTHTDNYFRFRHDILFIVAIGLIAEYYTTSTPVMEDCNGGLVVLLLGRGGVSRGRTGGV